MNHQCELVKDLMPLYVDEVCSEDSKNIVKEHLAECEACRHLYEKMQSKISIPVEGKAEVQGFKKWINKMVLIRTLILVVAFIVVWTIGNWVVTLHWSEVYPNIDAEGLESMVEVVEIDGNLYLYQDPILGSGQIVPVSTPEEEAAGIVKFYLGEQGLNSLDPLGRSRMWSGAKQYIALGGHREAAEIYEQEEPAALVIKQVIYVHKNGTQVATLWEEGQDVKEFTVK